MPDFPVLSLLALMLALPVSLLCQWWLLRRHWLGRMHEAQARHARHQARAEILLSITKHRMSSLQQQLTGIRPDALDAARLRARSAPSDADVILVEEDGGGRPMAPAEANAFADTVMDWKDDLAAAA